MTWASQGPRDPHGCWRPGVSGNPKGRPRGSKDRRPRRRPDPERATEWTEQDWHVFYRRIFQEAQGVPDEKHGAAFAAPIRVDGAWVHWVCLPWFLWARHDAAKAALERLGIRGGA